jgi:intein/homing endonuclease
MNIHPAQSYEAKVECEQILSVKANFMSSQDSKPLLSFKQDAMTGGYKLTFGYVKIPKYVFFDCLMIFPDMDIMEKIDHIKEVHRWKGLTQKEMDKLSKENPDMNKEELEQTAEDNLLYTGHSLFSFLLPNDFEYNCQNKICPLGNPIEITRGVLLSGTLNKVAIGNSSGSLIHHLYKDYNPQVALDFVSYYQMLINHWLIHHGFSIGLEDCVAHQTDMIEKEINNCLLEAEAVMKTEKDPEVSEFRVSNILNKATTLGQKIAKEALDPTNNLVSMIRSGAKGNDFNVTQITGLVGQQCVSAARIPKLFKGRTLPHFCKDTYASSSVDILSMNLEYDVSKIVESRGFVKNSYYRGLTPTEFFFHACGGREGVIDTACKSVVYETELLIMEDGKMKHIKIGEWIDEHMKNSKNIEEEEDEKRELLELENEVYIPTTDLKGNISWGKITAITRHDPTENMYEIKTLSGRDVTVTDSHSLLIWNESKQEFERVKPQFITVGSFVPTTSKLVEPPIINDYFENQFEFNYDNGVFLGICISLGYIYNDEIHISSEYTEILHFVSLWFDKYNVTYSVCDNIIIGFSPVLSATITTLVGKSVKYIHPECLNANKEFIKGLMNGIFSGDGYVSKNSVELSSASLRLINDVNICLSRLNIFGKISNDNNLKTENPADRNILSIRTFWLKNFQKEIKLLSVHKQEKLLIIVPNDFSSQFKLNNDVVLDKIVSIKKVEIKHNKVYDLTVPSTLNFGLYNGLHVVDTAKTGYIQRKMVKILEDIHFNYNNMVVNNFNQILEFSYGDDNMDISKLIKTNYGYSFIDVAHTTDILNKNNEWMNRNKLK